MNDGYIQVPPNSTGNKVDTSELTRADGTVVERQRISIGDPNDVNEFAAIAAIRAYGELKVRSDEDLDVQREILGQLKRIALLLEILTGKHVPLALVAA